MNISGVDISREDDGKVRLYCGTFMLELDDDVVAKHIPWVDEESK